jgi:hypothetical protein
MTLPCTCEGEEELMGRISTYTKVDVPKSNTALSWTPTAVSGEIFGHEGSSS